MLKFGRSLHEVINVRQIWMQVFVPWRRDQHFPPKRPAEPTTLHFS